MRNIPARSSFLICLRTEGGRISEVDSVHVGMVYCADTIRSNLFCLERDRLTGMWITPLELLVLRREDKLESWSRFIFDSILWKGGTYVT